MVERLCELLNICYKISNESDADVFFYYSPHCNSYDVCLFRDGWKLDVDMEYIANGCHITKDNLDATWNELIKLAYEKGVKL